MAIINIDTTDQNYRDHVTKFRNMRLALKPRIKLYQKLSDAQKESWLAKDVLLRELFEFAERIVRGKPDD